MVGGHAHKGRCGGLVGIKLLKLGQFLRPPFQYNIIIATLLLPREEGVEQTLFVPLSVSACLYFFQKYELLSTIRYALGAM